MSARFIYVSPAGTVARDDGEPLRVVDGGYFENSGAASISDLLNLIRPSDNDYLPILILIRNDPRAPDVCQRGGEASDRTARSSGFNASVSEVTAPVQTLLQTRQARGRLAEVEAARAIESLGGAVVEIPLAAVMRTQLARAEDKAQRERIEQRILEPPLGWSLSNEVREAMDTVLDRRDGGLDRELSLLEAALGGDTSRRCNAR